MKIKTVEDLRKLYAWPTGRAARKVLPQLEKHSIHFISKSPFLVLSSYDKNGKCDASPRGGDPGFVHIIDKNTLIIPDSKGNNRVDSLVNVVETGRIGLLFLIPGIDETLRVNGKGEVSTKREYLHLFKKDKNPPVSCIVIKIEEMFLHCAKAFMRSKLWKEDNVVLKKDFPTMGKMLSEQINEEGRMETREEMEKRYLPDL